MPPEPSSMISNLPLLFAGGYPTSIQKITEKQLEAFIPFMVQCSLGVAKNPREPEWWPASIPYTMPLVKPANLKEDWRRTMQKLVLICYEFHSSKFLLRFCSELAKIEPEYLRFISNYDSTTALYDRSSNKLLVTFRNENMLYDQQHNSNRKCLLPRSTNSQSSDSIDSAQQSMVEPALFDIYLCDYCDAELYSHDAYTEHERMCQSNDDDVIICEDDPPVDEKEIETSNHRKMSEFLYNFDLQSTNNSFNPATADWLKSPNNQSKEQIFSPEKVGRRKRKARGTLALSRLPSIPLSSPLGRFLIEKAHTTLHEDYISDRLQRIERYSNAPVNFENSTANTNASTLTAATTTGGSGGRHNKWSERRIGTIPITFKKPPADQQSQHIYKFPRRQASKRYHTGNFYMLNSLLIKLCKPLSVRLTKLTTADIDAYREKCRQKRLEREQIERDAAIRKTTTFDLPVDVIIDLCTSDEDEHEQEEADVEELTEEEPEETIDDITSIDNDIEFVSEDYQFVTLPMEGVSVGVGVGVGVSESGEHHLRSILQETNPLHNNSYGQTTQTVIVTTENGNDQESTSTTVTTTSLPTTNYNYRRWLRQFNSAHRNDFDEITVDRLNAAGQPKIMPSLIRIGCGDSNQENRKSIIASTKR